MDADNTKDVTRSPQFGASPVRAVSPEWARAIERAKMRHLADRKDWERNFKDRMSFDEYKLRLELNAQVTLGYMATERAMDILRKYRSANVRDDLSRNAGGRGANTEGAK